ncbi:uncharacterized protein L201_001841 [Kwoniella dendrophila CBS 6074]|uniref:DUF3533 domain-containing protein n=1 Tax=Kwoniella dendrophila CBS 6074 TaxID=1295534 RepID=A0AAX4JR03_9TREE
MSSSRPPTVHTISQTPTMTSETTNLHTLETNGDGSSPQPHERKQFNEKTNGSNGDNGNAASLTKPQDGGAGKPKLEKFKYSFFSPEMAMFRGIALKILMGTLVITIVVMWLTLPFYWGSLWKSNKYTDKLTVRIIDRDGGEIGQTVTQALLSEKNLRYFITSPSEFPDVALVEHDIVQEGAWASIVINPGASNALAQARSAGDSTYNSSSAIDVFYAQARQETAVNSYLLPYMQQALSAILGQYNARSAAQYLQANAGNATAINALASAPSTISNSVWFTLNNLRPYNQPVAQAITLVGLIYMLIFSFIITMANNSVREIIAPYMTTKAYLTYRIVAPITLYLFIAFFFAMVNLPFKVHFGAYYTHAGGFFLWAFSLFLGMTSVGLATEFMITILGPRFVAFFLLPLIISNVSVVSLPHELQPWIYKYGVAMPFYNASRVVRTIIFNTRNEIAQNLGILLAWIVLSIITITTATWLIRRKAINQHNKEVGENEMDVQQP